MLIDLGLMLVDQGGNIVGLCDQMNANALFCIYCDLVFSLF